MILQFCFASDSVEGTNPLPETATDSEIPFSNRLFNEHEHTGEGFQYMHTCTHSIIIFVVDNQFHRVFEVLRLFLYAISYFQSTKIL